MMLSLNLNSDLSLSFFREASRIAESAGYSRIWVGESIRYGHSFPLLATAAEVTHRIQIGAGIVSPQLNRCHHIAQAFRTLREVYGERFVVALAPGDAQVVKSVGAMATRPMEAVLECVKELRDIRESKGWNLPVYVGASGPRLIAEGSEVADGVLLNYVHPEYVEWAMRQMKRKAFTAAYGPALLLPDPENEPLLMSAARVVLTGANQTFLKELSFATQSGEKTSRWSTEDIDRLSMDRFTMAGESTAMIERLQQLSALGVDEVVLATPMCRNLASVETLAKLYFAQ